MERISTKSLYLALWVTLSLLSFGYILGIVLFIVESIQQKDCMDQSLDVLNLTTLSNGRKFRLFYPKNGKSWYRALKACEENRLELATISSKIDLLILHRELVKKLDKKSLKYSAWWLSATDFGQKPGEFIWQNGEQIHLNSDMWNSNLQQPDDFGENRTACVFYDKAFNNTLLDSPCHHQLNFICELPKLHNRNICP